MKKLFLVLFLPALLSAQPSPGVNQIRAGDGITITPTSGRGTVTINSTASGSGNVTNSGVLASGNIVVGGGTTVVSTTATGTGVVTAAGVNVGSAGAFVVNGGALGTPSSGTATNLTGTAAGLTAGTASAVAVGGITGLGTNVATALAINVGSAGAFLTTAVVEKLATFSVDGGGAAIATGTISGTATLPYACTITGVRISATGATGTTTVKFWIKETATTIPTIADVQNTAGISLTTGTSVDVTSLGDFADLVWGAKTMIRCAITAVGGTETDLTVTVYGTH